LRLIGSAGSKSEARLTTHRHEPELIEITVPDAQATPCPHLGLGMASDGSELTATEVARLRRLKLAHLRVDVRLAAPDWARVWDRAVRQARQLGVALELALHLPADGEGDMPAWKRCLQACATPLARVLALREGESATTRETLRRVRRAMSGFDAPVGAGSDANFCELNREQALGRLALAEADFIFWPINPQVHAFDNASIMETLEAQPDSVRTARRFAPGKPLVISPITLKPRFNAVATGVPPASSQDGLTPNVDARQLSLFTATWTLASFAALAGSGVASLTLYETTGWRGVMERETGSRFPERFPSAPGRVFPVYHTFAGLAGCESDTSAVVRKQSPVAALGLFGTEDDQRVLMGNLTPLPQHVHLRTSEPSAVVRVLDERQALVMSRSDRFHTDSNRRLSSHHGVMKLQLPPFALVWLEFRSLNPIPQEHK
jgi:hypothetical protein